MSAARRLLGLSAAFALLGAAPAAADLGGPDDSIATAYGPLVPGMTYEGAFVSETDVDYLAFDVTSPGQTLRFDVRNTVSPCLSPDLTGCPVYATLLDASGTQLGGEGSGAGTGPVTDDAPEETVDWTFPEPGRFYVAMDSGGDDPTYAISYAVVPPAPATPAGGGGGGGGGSGAGGTTTGTGNAGAGSGSGPAPTPGPVVADAKTRVRALLGAVSAAPAPGAPAVRVRVTVRRPLAALRVRVRDEAGRTIAQALRADVAPATFTVRLPLGAATRRALTRRGRLTLGVSVTATPVGGAPATARRSVRLRAR